MRRLPRSRRKPEDIAYEIIVVDNGSTRDGSVENFRGAFRRWRSFAIPETWGSASPTTRASRGRGRYVLVLNNDTVQTENALGAAVRYIDTHPDVGALGIQHRNADAARSEQPSAWGFPRPWREIASMVGVPWAGRFVPRRADSELDVDWVCGSFLLMRRACLEQVGPLDERFFIYDEDVDWCHRAWAAGWKVRFWPGTSMVHLGGAAQPFMKDKTFVHFRSHLSYIRKHHSWLPATLYYLVMMGRLTLATLWQAMRWLAGQSAFAEVRERASRQRQFALLRPGRTGG